MTIGIFGESFTCPWSPGSDPLTSWTFNLGVETKVHARGGASLFWIYMNFLENYEKYDQNIVVLAHAGRADHYGVIGNLRTAKNLLADRSLSEDEHDKAKLFYDYYTHIQHDEVDDMLGKLVIDGILRRRPDTILIPNHETVNYMDNNNVSNCEEYFLLQTQSLFPKKSKSANIWHEGYSDAGSTNHFTPEINQLFASHVKLALNGEGWKDWGVKDFPPIPHSKSWEHYFKKDNK